MIKTIVFGSLRIFKSLRTNSAISFGDYSAKCPTISKCLAVGGRGGFRSATSVRLHPDDATGAAKGGSGGEGRFIGASYRGNMTFCIGLVAVDPRIHRAMLSQQPQHTSDMPCRNPRCRARNRAGFTKACTYAMCRVTWHNKRTRNPVI